VTGKDGPAEILWQMSLTVFIRLRRAQTLSIRSCTCLTQGTYNEILQWLEALVSHKDLHQYDRLGADGGLVTSTGRASGLPPGRGWRVSHLHWTSSRITAWARVGPQVRNLGGSGLPLYILLVTCDRGNADLLLHGDRIPIFELEISLTWCNYPYQKKFSFELWMDRSYNPQCFDILSRSQFDVAGRGCAK